MAVAAAAAASATAAAMAAAMEAATEAATRLGVGGSGRRRRALPTASAAGSR